MRLHFDHIRSKDKYIGELINLKFVMNVKSYIFIHGNFIFVYRFFSFKRKYATHLFITPLSNVLSDNMMSRLILTLTKQFFDNQFTHFKIKTRKVSLKGLYFVA